jgi:hypothetical protein
LQPYIREKFDGDNKKAKHGEEARKEGLIPRRRARRPRVVVWKHGRIGRQEELGGQELNTRMSCPNIEGSVKITSNTFFLGKWLKELLREKVKNK